ncbi:NADPH:quinone oxidoreductase family protein [Streptomyces chartreusis]|uniref:NADPH:quinone oxidoreductase family protein n=1 Tax=Streptomyces chartreusis TaxID=1969 RepID=UPI00382A00F3
MKALICRELGSLDGLTVGEIAEPVPAAGQVLVEVTAAVVNYVDALMVLGRYQITPPTPFTPGIDIAGTIVATGPDRERFAVGDRVHGLAPFGGFAQRVAADETALRPTPDDLPSDLAATTGTTYWTAIDALTSVAKLQPGEDLVILGAAGAVGSAAIGIGKALGARVIACASTAEKLTFCTALGADEVIDYSSGSLKDAIKRLCPRGAGVVLDLVGGPATEAALRATGHGGRFIVTGFASGQIPKVPLNLVLLKGSSIAGYEILDFETHFPLDADTNRTRLESLLAEGTVKPPITARYGLDQAPQALARAAGRDKCGITLLDLSDGRQS